MYINEEHIEKSIVVHQLKLWNEDNNSNILVPQTQAYAMNKKQNDQVEIDDKVYLKIQAT